MNYATNGQIIIIAALTCLDIQLDLTPLKKSIASKDAIPDITNLAFRSIEFTCPQLDERDVREGLCGGHVVTMLLQVTGNIFSLGIDAFFREVGELVKDRFASPPPVMEETIARILAAEASGWREHHDTLPPQ